METFFQRRRCDFQMSPSQLSSSELNSSETDMNPTSASCENSNLSLVTSSDPNSEAKNPPISDSPCLDLASTLQTRPVPQIRLRDIILLFRQGECFMILYQLTKVAAAILIPNDFQMMTRIPTIQAWFRTI
jgi:hypothetical protein